MYTAERGREQHDQLNIKSRTRRTCSSTVLISVRCISGTVATGNVLRYASSVYRRYTTPLRTRPARPARWSADAREIGQIWMTMTVIRRRRKRVSDKEERNKSSQISKNG